MITKRVRIQLAVFSTLTAIAVALIAFHYVKVPALMGVGQVEAAAVFPEGAGIYPQANVTYRGVTVGKVTAVGLDPNGVKVSFRVASSAHIPSDVTASVKSVSAIGEQYVDLVPRGEGGPRLADGDVIPLADTSVPVQTAEVLDDADALLRSVPLRDLDTVLNEAEAGFDRLGPKLDVLTTNAMDLVNDADANYGQTHSLVVDGSRFLDGQLASSPSMRGWSRDLAAFSTTLRHSDGSLSSMLESVPGAANQADLTIEMLTEDLPPLITSGQVLADLGADYHNSIEDVLVAYPITAMHNVAYSTVHPDAMRLGFKVVANYPGSCSTGWPRVGEPLGPRSPHDISDERSAPGAYCKIPQDDARVVRGARNLPCFEPGSPPGRRAASIQQCRGDGYGSTGGDPAPTNFVSVPGADVVNGLLSYLGGPSGSASTTMTKEKSWQTLLLAPLGK